LERHYTVAEIAGMWHLDFKGVQRRFINEPGVLKEAIDGTLETRRYTLLRVPESLVIRVHRRSAANNLICQSYTKTKNPAFFAGF
jgi:hypothetical protein